MKYVIALGGNAITDASSIDKVAKEVARMYLRGDSIVITHGNGPQVGELAEEQHRNLSFLTAETQAWIGTVIKERLSKELAKTRGDYASIVEVVVTEVVVEPNEKLMHRPVKPIGRFYTEKEAAEGRKLGLTMKKLIGGYRRIVPSPNPERIVQMDVIAKMLEQGKIVIACGGGGIPVHDDGRRLKYFDAVVDKDRASALLAKEIGADRFFILTNVDGVYLNYKRKGQRMISRIKAASLKKYLKGRQFEEGSIKPKVESTVDFVESTGKTAGIGSLGSPKDVFSLKKLTLIQP